jgi:hypothetical protein
MYLSKAKKPGVPVIAAIGWMTVYRDSVVGPYNL